MAGKQAKTLSDDDISDPITYTTRIRNPTRNVVIVLLSAKAGLRPAEIANLTWSMVLDPHGQVGEAIELRDQAAKNRSDRRIPIHPDLPRALDDWFRASVELAMSSLPSVVGRCDH